tara:strand:+ start:8881 stop:9318 length:438 start_codon:yes stop_codon:yes gene_type:complete
MDVRNLVYYIAKFFPDLITNKISYYLWKNRYVKSVISNINSVNKLKTLEISVLCPYIQNRNHIYQWNMLYWLLHPLFLPHGRWNKYIDTLKKKSERIIKYKYFEKQFTPFPLKPSTFNNDWKIHEEYYYYPKDSSSSDLSISIQI